MKYVFALVLSMVLSGCTANDWVNAASGIMQAKDKQEKDTRKRHKKQAYKSS